MSHRRVRQSSKSCAPSAGRKATATRASLGAFEGHSKSPSRRQPKRRIEQLDHFDFGTMAQMSDGSVELNFRPSAQAGHLKGRDKPAGKAKP